MTRLITLSIAFLLVTVGTSQDLQNVNLEDGTTITHPISEIDSISFSPGGTDMVITLMDGTQTTVALAQIDSVAFGYPGTWSFTDPRDGTTYNALMIGDQCWMAENLKYLPAVSPAAEGGSTDPVYYVHGYNGTNVNAAKMSAHFETYGALYNWPAANADVCPPGWHLPTDEEVKQLEMHLGMSQANADDTGYRGPDQGAKLAGSNLWQTLGLTNDPAFGSSGFDALPGGVRAFTGTFSNTIGQQFALWTSTETSETLAYNRVIYYGHPTIARHNQEKRFGFSVRCVCDQ